MKITELRVFLINPGNKVSFGTGWGKNTILVKIYTDEGIAGLGEAFGTGKAKSIEAALEDYSRWLIGKDPAQIVRHWQALYRGARYPLGTASLAALSAVEQALWDIAGKACGLPIYKMLGGPTRDKIRLYASGYLAQPSHFDLPGGTLVESCQAVVEQGFTAIKITPQPDDFRTKTGAQVFHDSVDRVRQVREALGPTIDICLDYHGRSLSPTAAIQLAREIEPFHPLFLEEPALSETPDSLLDVKRSTTIPIAAGERCVSRDRLREIIHKRAVDILQPEPTANGGILETVKWSAMAELEHITIAPHQACSPVSLLACAHIDASITNFLIQECNVDFASPLFKDLFDEMPTMADGHLHLPQRPGLGIELNEEAAEKYPFRPFDRPVIIEADGSIGLE